ncbi:radical SAM protein [Myxococcota bacterium]|nr:radical SAM protein [Myxococcota bacterium]MBU1379401.1 radical SAM protein [Myxococcota bacterium]MBU1496803.1 radical SAM protein [Myxococcota bacterium]
MKVRVYEIFKSIQGESSFQGYPCIFIRLAGCPLNCRWCDTPHARNAEGKELDILDIVNNIVFMGGNIVEVTGGEPLAQEGAIELLSALCEKGFTVLLETSGALPLDKVPHSVHIIMDFKGPSSGEDARMLTSNFAILDENDEVKFPIADRDDFENALRIIREYDGPFRKIASPVSPLLDAGVLARWILAEGPPTLRLQIQLHKVIDVP